MAALSPDLPARGPLVPDNCLSADAIAATLIQWLGEDYRHYNNAMSAPMKEFLP
jgi:hypothetical protein